MPAIFSKNCILEGEVDLYCLACCVYLQTEDDAISHIQESKHKDIIKFLGYFEKHEQDFIRKVNGIYFCEMCNVTMSTATKVKLHVTEAGHSAGRRHRALARCARGDVVSPGGVRVSAGAWHGLLGDTCVLCAVESVHADTHTRDRAHVLNLIQAAVTIRDTGDVYRKVEEFFQCLTCNKVISEHQLNEHFNSEEHKKVLLESKQIELSDTNELNITMKEKDDDIQENTDTDIQPNISSESSNAKITETEEEQKATASCMPNVLETFAKDNDLLVKENNIVYCDVCKTQIDANLNKLKDHINSRKHTVNKNTKNQAETTEKNTEIKKNESISSEKVLLFEHVKSMQIVFAENDAFFIVNESLCIDVNAFMGINIINKKFRCRICDVDLTESTVPIHVYTEEHKHCYTNSYVFTSLKDEFVRQINPDKYDCSYCLKTEKNFPDMLAHLSTAGHKKRKTKHQKHFKEFTLLMAQGLIAHINLNNFVSLDPAMLQNINKFSNLKM